MLPTDLVVDDGVSEGGFIEFVVPVASVALDVDEEVLAEALTVLDCELADAVDLLWVVGVDVEDWVTVCLGDIS